tara:strand:- start:15301 stop:16779 length:1479 start_codon:yes stop_codon:yes gene_type:complete
MTDHSDTPRDQEPHDEKPIEQASEQVHAEHADDQAPADGLAPRRAASVRFNREQSSVAGADHIRMDTAHQSLADALRITYGLLQVGMVVLLILFVFSGFQKVNEGERGISVFLGKPAQTNIEPGAHLTWPYPIGELITVTGGAEELELAGEFMPSTSSPPSLSTSLTSFGSLAQLNPASSFSVITADQNIAHAQWKVNYHRSDHLSNQQNIYPQAEGLMIRQAIRRGVVQTIAEIDIDDLLKKSAETIAAKVRQVAQDSLDQLDAGITIDRVVLVRKTPPLYLLDQFASVQSAAQNAGKLREDALLSRDQLLNDVAGRAAGVLIDLIDQYERHIELKEDEQAVAVLAQIDSVLAGEEIDYNGQSTLGLVSGEVSEILIQAKAQSSSRISQAIADLSNFQAKQAQYDANPSLMIARDWSLAMGDFLGKDFVETMYLPEGVDLELMVNRDPEISRELDKRRREKEAIESYELRNKSFREANYKSQRGIQQEDEP